MDEVVFDSEKDPALMRRSNGKRAGLPLGQLITPGPKKDEGKMEKVVLGVLGTVLAASVFIAFKTQPKEIVVITPIDASVINPAIIKQ